MIAFLGIGAGVMAFGDNGDSSPPTSTTQEVQPVGSIDTTPSTTAAPPLAAGFEDYTPGDPIATPPAPVGDAPVQTVPGPYGDVYPDGYVAPEYRTPEQGGTAETPTMPETPITRSDGTPVS